MNTLDKTKQLSCSLLVFSLVQATFQIASNTTKAAITIRWWRLWALDKARTAKHDELLADINGQQFKVSNTKNRNLLLSKSQKSNCDYGGVYCVGTSPKIQENYKEVLQECLTTVTKNETTSSLKVLPRTSRTIFN